MPRGPVHAHGTTPLEGGVSVLLPMHRAAPGLDAALESALAQSPAPAEILLLVNGPSREARLAAAAWGARDTRVRVIDHPEASLAAALNRGIRAARCDLLARADDDDLSLPGRFAAQIRALAANPALAAVGGAFEVVAPDGTLEHIIRPPTDPARLRWELLLGNTLAHGSAMLRRSAVLAAGGYDESFEKAQDYDLWLRLARSMSVGAVDSVVYRYRRPEGARGRASSSPLQQACAERARLREWSRLEPGGVDAALVCSDLAELERELDSLGPMRALLERVRVLRGIHEQVPEHDRRVLIDAAFARVSRAGAAGVWLWGAGEHTRRVLERDDLPLPVLGLVDDSAAGCTRFGFRVQRPEQLPLGAHVIVSSDAHEQRILARARTLPEGRVSVHPIYGVPGPHPGECSQRSTASAPPRDRRVS